MLKAKDIHKGFDGLGVLEGITIQVEKGQVVALIGPSGSGKSTFLRCVNQLERIDRGEISLDGDKMCWMGGRTAALRQRGHAAAHHPAHGHGLSVL